MEALTGVSPSTVQQTLARGGIVVFDKKLVSDGTAQLQVVQGEQASIKTVPAVHVQTDLGSPPGLMSRAKAQELGLTVEASEMLFSTSRMPTKEEVAQATAALEDRGFLLHLQVERGFESSLRLILLALVGASAIITLGSSGIATGLALADGRADQTTLGAIGASPRIRRLLAASQAGTISWLGSGLGILAGLVPGIAVVWAQQQLRIVIPWVGLTLILVAVPVLAMLAALLFTRSRLALARRID